MQQKRVSVTINVFLRVFIAVGFGSIVVALALVAGFDSAKTNWLMLPQLLTRHELSIKKREIETFRKINSTLPRTLSQLKSIADRGHYDSVIDVIPGSEYTLTNEPDGVLNDEWGRPFVYEVNGTHYRVISYGQDGKPGGIGVDTDLTTDNLHPPYSDATFAQYLHHEKTEWLIPTAFLCGMVAAALCFMLTRPIIVMQQTFWFVLMRLAALFIATAFVTALITLLHFPAYH